MWDVRLALHDDGVADDVESVPGVPGPRLRVEAGQEVGGGPVARLDQQDTQTDRQLEKREEMKDYSRTPDQPDNRWMFKHKILIFPTSLEVANAAKTHQKYS